MDYSVAGSLWDVCDAIPNTQTPFVLATYIKTVLLFQVIQLYHHFHFSASHPFITHLLPI